MMDYPKEENRTADGRGLTQIVQSKSCVESGHTRRVNARFHVSFLTSSICGSIFLFGVESLSRPIRLHRETQGAHSGVIVRTRDDADPTAFALRIHSSLAACEKEWWQAGQQHVGLR
jgi:hypothetical protein